MKKHFFFLGILTSCCLHAQEKKSVMARIYISPVISSCARQHTTWQNGSITSQTITKKVGVFWGGGAEVLKKLPNDFLLGGDFAFISKGSIRDYSTVYYNNSISGTGFNLTELPYLETTIFVEKQALPKNKKDRIFFSSGLFWGLHASNIGGLILQAKGKNDIGNDFGVSCAVGLNKKKFFTKVDFKQGLKNIRNDNNASVKTSIIVLKIGRVINQ